MASKDKQTSPSAALLDAGDPSLYEVLTHGPGPQGRLPLTDEMLRHRPSGDAFGMTQDAGMAIGANKMFTLEVKPPSGSFMVIQRTTPASVAATIINLN